MASRTVLMRASRAPHTASALHSTQYNTVRPNDLVRNMWKPSTICIQNLEVQGRTNLPVLNETVGAFVRPLTQNL